MEKNKLLTIGELAKLSCISIHSVRYYERINILKPAFIDPETNYRYYSFEQLFHVRVITFCIELDVPLKELHQFMDDEKTIDYLALLDYGEKIAQEKLQKIKNGISLINNAKQQILESTKLYQKQKIYTKNLAEKYFHIMPYDKPFGGKNQFEEVIKAFLRFELGNDEDYGDFLESGLLYEYSQSSIKRYIYVELAYPMKGENVKVIPSGIYFCIQNQDIAIEKTQQIFADYLNDEDSYLAIETAFFAGKYEIDKPISELRIITGKF